MSEEMSEESFESGEELQEAAAPTVDEGMQAQPEGEAPGEQVPLSALQSERAQRQQLAEQLQMMKDHMALMDARQKESQPKPKDSYDELPDDDIPTWGEIKKVLTQREKQYQTTLTEMQMAQKYPDYSEVISNYLPSVIKENPSLRSSLEKSQDYELAYYLAKNSDNYKSANKRAKKNQDAERMVKNAQQAGSLSSMGSVSPINSAKRYREMSDDDFRKEINKNLGYS